MSFLTLSPTPVDGLKAIISFDRIYILDQGKLLLWSNRRFCMAKISSSSSFVIRTGIAREDLFGCRQNTDTSLDMDSLHFVHRSTMKI